MDREKVEGIFRKFSRVSSIHLRGSNLRTLAELVEKDPRLVSANDLDITVAGDSHSWGADTIRLPFPFRPEYKHFQLYSRITRLHIRGDGSDWVPSDVDPSCFTSLTHLSIPVHNHDNPSRLRECLRRIRATVPTLDMIVLDSNFSPGFAFRGPGISLRTFVHRLHTRPDGDARVFLWWNKPYRYVEYEGYGIHDEILDT
ncbi:hypothetical protein C8J56DRAFT_922430 [Mycena floridula]|nr:hypothetical protein C8J56DRAFT_922430 [Mycena floridula]